MRSGAEKALYTILECLFLTSGIDMKYFRRVTKNSNKYGRYHLKNRKFGGIEWIDMTVKEMLHYYVVMTWISIEFALLEDTLPTLNQFQ